MPKLSKVNKGPETSSARLALDSYIRARRRELEAGEGGVQTRERGAIIPRAGCTRALAAWVSIQPWLTAM